MLPASESAESRRELDPSYEDLLLGWLRLGWIKIA